MKHLTLEGVAGKALLALEWREEPKDPSGFPPPGLATLVPHAHVIEPLPAAAQPVPSGMRPMEAQG